MSDLSTHSARPPLLRGNTVPLYVRTSYSSSSAQDQARQPEGSSQAYSAHPDKYSSLGRRDQTGMHGSSAASISRMPQNWQVPPTPPLSTSPGSAESYAQEEAYFPAVSASQQHSHAVGSVRSARSHGAFGSPPLPSMTSPTITSSPASFQLLRNTYSSAPMRLENTTSAYILSATIGPGFDSSCITISMRKNNILNIVADRWDLEKGCHHEWQVQFDRHADMSGVHANYTNGVLTVTVKRLNHSAGRPPQMKP
ncbi:uncharacterized protein FOMMEDRAFT_139085 [Fomitiporia mediterranea MF3/22]|uniref:uncharacterized protein n=1 Tax=Fomitiporia mediterranea (strain MF3/22) TaxID=694068 RepID=UPI0004408C87|nr:uncharacterized protein FOMMEDRAFT_139085 [Fomitiporia mediterranea MF3/22]EJD05724.1 hypothetical protein FOMMEDRAFT_139085 [Fomitiporia mediterranea MF3/22]